MGNSNVTSQAPVVKPTQPPEYDANSNAGQSAIILGATGATGVHLVQQLLCSNRWAKVTIIHRREIDVQEITKSTGISFTEEQQSKLFQHVVDMSKLTDDENVEKFAGHDIIFCSLGTTRGKAKSAENFRKIDLYMVRDAAIAGKKAGVKHFSLVSSMGANAGLWANDWKLTHGLLYVQVKGLAEAAVVEQKFSRTSIWRPGGLDRLQPEGKSIWNKVFDSTLVSELAAVMILDAEFPQVPQSQNVNDDQKQDENESEIISPPVIFEMSMITSLLPLARRNRNKCLPMNADLDVKEEIVNTVEEKVVENVNVVEENEAQVDVVEENEAQVDVVENEAQVIVVEENEAQVIVVEENEAQVSVVEDNEVQVNVVEENEAQVNVVEENTPEYVIVADENGAKDVNVEAQNVQPTSEDT